MAFIKRYTSCILSVFLGLFFLGSAYLKLADILIFEEILSSYGSAYISYLAPLIIITEFYLGLHLLFLINIKSNARLSLILVFFFTIIYTYGYFFKDVASCGCFGGLDNSVLDNPLMLYFKNIVLIVLSYFIYTTKSQINISEEKLRKVVVYLVLGFSIYLTGFKFKPIVYISKQTENVLIHQSIEKLNLKSVYNFSNDSTYLVFLFSYSCSHCLNSVTNVNLFKSNKYVDQVLFIPFGKEEGKLMFNKEFNLEGVKLENNISTISGITDVFPTTLFIRNNSVIFVHEGFIPSPLVFYRKNSHLLNR